MHLPSARGRLRPFAVEVFSLALRGFFLLGADDLLHVCGMDYNPYSSSNPPASVYAGSNHGQSAGNLLTPTLMQSLAGTAPWVKFCSVIGFIFTGLMLVLALGMFVASAVGIKEAGPIGGVMLIGGVFYLVIGFLYFFPSMKLWKYGSGISQLMLSQQVADLEQAIEAQRVFWKFVGIMIIVTIALYLLFIAGMMVTMVGIGSRMGVP